MVKDYQGMKVPESKVETPSLQVGMLGAGDWNKLKALRSAILAEDPSAVDSGKIMGDLQEEEWHNSFADSRDNHFAYARLGDTYIGVLGFPHTSVRSEQGMATIDYLYLMGQARNPDVIKELLKELGLGLSVGRLSIGLRTNSQSKEVGIFKALNFREVKPPENASDGDRTYLEGPVPH